MALAKFKTLNEQDRGQVCVWGMVGAGEALKKNYYRQQRVVKRNLGEP